MHILWYGHIYDDNLCKQFGSRSCPIKILGLIWIQPDIISCRRIEWIFIEIYIYPYKSIVLFVGHRQTAQTQTRRQITWLLIRVSTFCLPNVLLKFDEKYHQTTLKRKWTRPIDRNGNQSTTLLIKDICDYFQCAPFPRLQARKVVWVLSFDP